MSRRLDLGAAALTALNLAILAFLLLPLGVIVLFALNDAPFIDFPPRGLSLRWIEKFLTSADFMAALAVSLQLALLVVLIAVVIGTMAALALVRGSLPFAEAMQALFLAPLMVPALLTGLGVFQLFFLLGWPRGAWALVIAHSAIATPYVIRTVTAVLRQFDRSIERAAASLGAAPWRVFVEVTLPLIRPGIIAGAVFAFIISFDQFEVSLFLVDPGSTTLPIFLFNYLRFNFDPTLAAASLVSLVLAGVTIALVERLVGLQHTTRF